MQQVQVENVEGGGSAVSRVRVRPGWRAYVTCSDAACTSTEDKDWQGQRESKETSGLAVKTQTRPPAQG